MLRLFARLTSKMDRLGLASVISVPSIIRVTRERNFEDIRENAVGHAHTLHLVNYYLFLLLQDLLDIWSKLTEVQS